MSNNEYVIEFYLFLFIYEKSLLLIFILGAFRIERWL